MFILAIHSFIIFLKEIHKFPLQIYSLVFLRVEFPTGSWKSEAIRLPTDDVGVDGPYVAIGAICSVFLDVWDICRYCAGGGGEIWITSWGMRRINPCKNRQLLPKSLRSEVLGVFTDAVSSLLASSFLHCLSSYSYIDDTLYKQFIQAYIWFINILRTFLTWIICITHFVSTSEIYL